MAFLRKKTEHGYSIGDLYSWAQKAFRRSLHSEVIFCLREIATVSVNAVRIRLVQNLLEDSGHIGLANEIVKNISEKDCKTKGNSALEKLLCYAMSYSHMDKTHEPAWLTRIGMKHAINHFDRLNVIEKEENLYDCLGKAMILYAKKDMDMFNEVKGILKVKSHPLVITSYIGYHIFPEWQQPYKIFNIEEINEIQKSSDMEKYPSVPDYAYDKHTSKGKSLGRGMEWFYSDGLKTKQMLYQTGDPHAEEAKQCMLRSTESLQVLEKLINTPEEKEDTRDTEDNIEHTLYELGFRNILHAQLKTGKTKASVFLVKTCDTKKKYVLKGPVKDKEMNGILISEEIKKILGLPRVHMRKYPELSGYVVCKSLLDYNKNQYEIKSSKLETDVKVSTETKSLGWEHNMIKHLGEKCLVALLFRKCIGANDTYNRNLIVANNNIYSIDDAAFFVDTPYMWKLKLSETKRQDWENVANKVDWHEIVRSWIDKLDKSDCKHKGIFVSRANDLLKNGLYW